YDMGPYPRHVRQMQSAEIDPPARASRPHETLLVFLLEVRFCRPGIDPMQRREFTTLLGCAWAAWPIAARAQSKLAAIGMLGSGFAESSAILLDAFKQGLRENGLN